MTTQRETKLQHDQWYDEAISAGDKLAGAGVPELKAVNSERLVASLKNLRGEAAKVPGLEADNAALLEALRRAGGALGDAQPNIGWGTPPRLACGKAYDAAGAVADADHPGASLLERLATLKSERDAARQTVSAAASRERELMARTSLAESDRDIAKGEVDVLREQLKEARKDAKEALAEHQHLLERVATLETCVHSEAERHRRNLLERDAAEARVKELEAGLHALHDVACTIPTEHDDVRLDKAIAAARVVLTGSTSQPPPAPAQALTRGDVDPTKEMTVLRSALFTLRGLVDAPAEYGHTDVVMEANSLLRKMRESAPTPPALVEAVGPVFEEFRKWDAETGHLDGRWPMNVQAPRSTWRAALAAYDAARTAPPTPISLLEAVGRVLPALAHVERVADGRVAQARADLLDAITSLRAAYDAKGGGR
ncbi:hypothetical protein LXT21_44040 [Myxococcus sp. K38C18041901]|uniref:hypothetical protein n=1 Tax=Myxococcus guangdongensis TaxID=2906760 RepID=UPI0020A746F7|nr:hypothetical protein [Myxococcus guangdongensis]MCP3065760.1 hypothetical protein [Myxococcus guangdongensis]